jgi:hypothetical protein
VRVLLAALVLVAVCAVAGCTTVSAPPAAPLRPVPSALRQVAPDGAVVLPSPGRQLLATARPEPAGQRPSPAATRTARARTSAAPHRRRGHATHKTRPHRAATPTRKVDGTPSGSALPGSAGVCELGESYGGWQPDSPAARICRQAYGG